MSAVRIGIEGSEDGCEAHWRAWATLVEFRPARARFLSGEEGVFRNLSASLITYFPVKPEAPKIIISYRGGDDDASMVEFGCKNEEDDRSWMDGVVGFNKSFVF